MSAASNPTPAHGHRAAVAEPAASGSGTGTTAQPSRRALVWEIVIVLALSLGRSGVNAIINLIDLASRAPISQGTATLNQSASARPWIDLSYQLSDLIFSLAPVALVLWLLARWPGGSPWRRLGLDLRKPGGDLWRGVVLFVVIGAGTLGVYAAGRALGITTAISTSGIGGEWWSVPILLLAALRNGLLEEVVVASLSLWGAGRDLHRWHALATLTVRTSRRAARACRGGFSRSARSSPGAPRRGGRVAGQQAGACRWHS